MSATASTTSTLAALRHLRKTKPRDGWSVETKSGSSRLVRLLRRNVPLTDSYFLDIHHDSASDSVVGILTNPNAGKAQAQVLVDTNGKPTGTKIQLISVCSYTPEKAAPAATRPATRTNNAARNDALTDDQNKEILQYAAMILGGMIVLRILLQAMVGVYLAVPLLYLYLLSTCPPNSSFDAKKELKRVLRGHHLPEDHPEKPSGFFGETLARINATLTTELATGLGYEVTMMPMAGAVTFCSVRVPAAQMDCYWIGAAHKWWYVYSRQLPDE